MRTISPRPLPAIRHASIDAATRAERGLPEDLIRLCVGIEDPADLIDDLERALLEAGAITVSAGADEQQFVRASLREGVSISRAVEKLAFNENKRPLENREWFVSAPGKVILFGEHAVVHGVVSAIFGLAELVGPDSRYHDAWKRPTDMFRSFYCCVDRCGGVSGPALLWTNFTTA